MNHSAIPDGSPSPAALVIDLAFEALRTNDSRLNALALELFGCFGQPLVRPLIVAASDRKNKPAHRLRVLQAIQRIGRIDDATSLFDLVALTRGGDLSIRKAAAAVFLSLQPHCSTDLTSAPDAFDSEFPPEPLVPKRPRRRS